MPAPLPRGVFRQFFGTVFTWGGRLLLLAYFLAATLILLGRSWLMPEIAQQRDWVAARLSEAIGLPVSLAGLTADWPGLHPHLGLSGLQIHDREGRPALYLERVEAEIGWSSLWQLGVQLHRLEIHRPALDVRRDTAGVVSIAGLPMQGEGDGSLADWLLAQRRIVVREARIVWHDALRAAPPLTLDKLDAELRNLGQHHSFGLSARPVDAGAQRIDLRGNLTGNRIDDPSAWRGELYADLEQADVAAWAPWIDLPLEWRSGRGSVRFWLNFAERQAQALTADLRVTDVAARLGPELPMLALDHLQGRLTVKKTADGYGGEIRRLSLATQGGPPIPAIDARLEYHEAGTPANASTNVSTNANPDTGGGGAFSASTLDLAALSNLAIHLPLPAEVLEALAEFSPRGEVDHLKLQWRGAPDALHDWQAEGTFRQLALAPYRELPGFAGISGRFAGSARAGEIHIDSHAAHLILPQVFAEAQVALNQLSIDAGWRRREDGLEFSLVRSAFSNADAHGEATGTYLYTGKGLGTIDLSARLKNASGTAVWRYMPLVVNADARDWLKRGILGGVSDETTLRLKGPLDAFPFADGKQGIFQVKGSIRNGTLAFAPDWPQITGIDGELLFEGVRMLIRGRRAEIMGVQLNDVAAEISRLDAYEELLSVTGQARGATQKFFDFIEASPVGEMIDHFTAPMTAQGDGMLELKLDLPLRKLAATRVQGKYRLANNTLTVLPALPPLTAVQGDFAFTENRLNAKNLQGRLFGAPVNARVTSAAGGVVTIDAKGTATVRGLQQEYTSPLLDHLSGQTAWSAAIRVKKPGAEVRIESQLDGLSSSLPAPFNKSAADQWPLEVNGRIEAGGDTWNARLANLLEGRLRLNEASRTALPGLATLRGQVSIGEDRAPLGVGALPAQGLAITLSQPSLDLDGWRRILAGLSDARSAATASSEANPGGKPAAAGLKLASFDIDSPQLRFLGREFHALRLRAQPLERGSQWRIDIDSREARGQLRWTDSIGSGASQRAAKLSGRLGLLAWSTADATQASAAANAAIATDEPNTEQPPDIDLTIDDFRLRDMHLGAVRLAAENRAGSWNARLEAKNDAARLTGEGRWLAGKATPETRFSFKLDIDSTEKLLARLGLPDAVRGGSGKIEGNLHWPGSPTAFDVPMLSGQLDADLGKGQFKQLEPGVGRLLGVLSLQTLPRRITLDFRDIFSEGFAFDSIRGAAALNKGVLHSENFNIRGPAAKVLLSGQVDLNAETQDLTVRVQPAVGETIAVGAMIANPVIGAVAWLAQKALNDPLDQAFAYAYAVKGGWADPQVEKLTRTPPGSAAPPPP